MSHEFKGQPHSSNKQVLSIYNEYLCDNTLNLRPAYQRALVWSDDQKSKLIDSIMGKYPMPIFLLYICDTDPECAATECIDGQNRLSTIKEYMEQSYEENDDPPFSWIRMFDDEEHHVFYPSSNQVLRESLKSYCDIKNSERSKKKKVYRLMTDLEKKRYDSYNCTLSIIDTPLTFEQRKEIFNRWQSGTSISQCDRFKNEPYPFCKFVLSDILDNSSTYIDCLSDILSSGRKNWLFDVYRLLKLFMTNDMKEAAIDTISVRTQITNNTPAFSKDMATVAKEESAQFLQLLTCLSEIPKEKNKVRISFLLEYAHIWRNATPEDRMLLEDTETILFFAAKSVSDEYKSTFTTLNNGPQKNTFHRSVDKFETLVQQILEEKKKSKEPVKRPNVPKVLKTQVWDRYIGSEKGKAPCVCCGINEIDKAAFQAGHVIPWSKGGPTTIENLRPICTPCNNSMGTTNMADFAMKHYTRVI
jgi:5-methylcytosine-specific restriction endonuclease McrA